MLSRVLRHDRVCLVLLLVFLVVWGLLAVAPYDRGDWLLENLLTMVFVPLIVVSYWLVRFSLVSYAFIFLFLCLHSLGAHYTYAEVPYDAWSEAYLGFSVDQALGWSRNNFDRCVHFSYGLLIAYPVREIFFRVANARGFWGYFLPLDLVMSSSMIFELIEWVVAENVGGDLGMAYLGTQGDVWDAHKDMALASLGALIAMGATLAVNLRYQRDFAREWQESLRLKLRAPMGESRLLRLLRRKRR
jgi:putative membrane protein